MALRSPVLMKAKGDTDVHYCWIPQINQPTTVCGVDCGEFLCTNEKVNCPDCRDKIDGLIDAGVAKVIPHVLVST